MDLDQLKQEANEPKYQGSAYDNAKELTKFIKGAREKCLKNFRETRKRLE